MKTEANKANSISRDFWANPVVDLSYFYGIKTFTDQVKAFYNEDIQKWPNNSGLSEDYSCFLVEGVTNFSSVLEPKYRADLIEQGKNYVVDFSFRSLMRTFPTYLKKYIVNIQGHFITESSKNAKLN
jgi:hypothetical protein